MKIGNNKVVTITYTLKVISGQIVDEATATKPFLYLHGAENVLPKFEDNLAGLAVGDAFDFKLSAADGYGEYDEEYVHEFERGMFAQVPTDMMELGRILPMQDQFGNPLDGEIVEITDETIILDFNHPLAGEELHFVGKVLHIREASKDEIDHGHTHGEGGVIH
jgi:FKBP-type peptidyl-prolyl cis-trans isomerase SlyD